MNKKLPFSLLLLVCLIAIQVSYARKIDLFKLAKTQAINNAGTDFWFTIPPMFEDESAGQANFIKLFITAPTKTLVTVDVVSANYHQVQNTLPNDVIEFLIDSQVGCVWLKKAGDYPPKEKVYHRAGIHVWADQPLVVYCIVRYHYTSEGFLAMPVASLGKEYIVASYPDMSAMYPGNLESAPSETGIVTPFDSTKVKFILGGNSKTTTPAGLKSGQSVEYNLNKGDVLLFTSNEAYGDLTGSKIESTKPVSVVSGNYIAQVPVDNQYGEYLCETEQPTNTWGKTYYVGKIPFRKYSSIIRIFAKDSNTTIFRDGDSIGLISYPGGKIGEGFLDMRMTVDSVPKSVVISGDKPINVVLYNTGSEEDLPASISSDPFEMAITPVEQFQTEITFCTPGVNGDGFPNNYINLVYEQDANGKMPVDMEFAEVHGGQFTWQRIDDKFGGKDEPFAITTNGKNYSLKLITLQHDGVYKIRAKKPFAAYSFGFSEYDAYGYPTSSAMAETSRPDTLPPVPKWVMSCDGSVTGTITDMPDDASIRSNLALITMDPDSSYNYKFHYDDFVPGETRTTNWSLKVEDLIQDARAIITFMDRRGNDTTIIITYYPNSVTIRPYSINFRNILQGQLVSGEFYIINLSKNRNFYLDTLFFLGETPGFKLNFDSLKLPYIILPDDSVKIKITFTALNIGFAYDSLGFGDTCISYVYGHVDAEVTDIKPPLKPIINVSDINPDSCIIEGKPCTYYFSVKNTGDSSLTISGFTGPRNPVYTTNIKIFLTDKVIVLNPGEYRVFTVDFTPLGEFDYTDTITFFSDAKTIDSLCIINARGISDVKGNDLGNYCDIYPNPAKDIITISLYTNNPGILTVKIYDILGNIVSEPIDYKFNNSGRNTFNIDVSKINNGVYIFQIMLNNNIINKTFSVIR